MHNLWVLIVDEVACFELNRIIAWALLTCPAEIWNRSKQKALPPLADCDCCQWQTQTSRHLLTISNNSLATMTLVAADPRQSCKTDLIMTIHLWLSCIINPILILGKWCTILSNPSLMLDQWCTILILWGRGAWCINCILRHHLLISKSLWERIKPRIHQCPLSNI